MKNILDFKRCPVCESKEITIYRDSFLCLSCHCSISSEIGYQPDKISQMKMLMDEKDIAGEFADILLKDNTISFEKRMKLINIYTEGNKEEKENIIQTLKSYKEKCENIIGEAISVDKEILKSKRKDADRFFKEFGAVNMSEYFENNQFIAATGRDEEVNETVSILKNKDKSCALIIGPEGSGISNLLLTVAYKIVNGDIPALKGCPVYKIDSAFINVGSISGELERTLKDIIQNGRNADAILLFDDCEQLAEQGVHRGTNLDVCDRLVTAIDGVKIIFSTSENKFADKLAGKPTFIRKTYMVKIKELDITTSVEIMKKMSDKLLIENKTHFTESIIEQIAELSLNIKHRNFPDKCISLMEKTSMRCRPSEKYSIYDIKRTDIIETLSAVYQVRILEDTNYRMQLLTLSDKMKEVIKGQDKAIEAVCNELFVRDFRRCDNAARPSVFYATGPTGVGKTEMAKRIAEFLTNNKNGYFRLDMSQFNEPGKISLLTGSEHTSDKDSDFMKWARNHPSGVLILDEFEKASPFIQQIFMPVFDQGNMSTPRGRLYFNNMIIFITSNAVTTSPRSLGFNGGNSTDICIQDELAKYLPTELVNRVQNVIFFEPLTLEICEEIVRKICSETTDTFLKKGINVSFSDELIRFVTKKGYSPKFNARELDRYFDKLVLLMLSKFYFSSNSKKWHVDIVDGEVSVIPKNTKKEKMGNYSK